MISNSSPLILLAKIGQLELLKKLFGYVTITDDVKAEVLIENKPGSANISAAIGEGWIKVANPKRMVELGLGKGENSVISLAKQKKDGVILDDATAIRAAKALGVNFLRTTTLVIMAVEKKFVSKKQAVSIINELIGTGYYVRPKYISAILTKLSE